MRLFTGFLCLIRLRYSIGTLLQLKDVCLTLFFILRLTNIVIRYDKKCTPLIKTLSYDLPVPIYIHNVNVYIYKYECA